MSIEGKWIYLPEVPDSNRNVIIAHTDLEDPVHGYYSRWGEGNTTWMDNSSDAPLMYQGGVYAWRELPELPPLPEDKGRYLTIENVGDSTISLTNDTDENNRIFIAPNKGIRYGTPFPI